MTKHQLYFSFNYRNPLSRLGCQNVDPCHMSFVAYSMVSQNILQLRPLGWVPHVAPVRIQGAQRSPCQLGQLPTPVRELLPPPPHSHIPAKSGQELGCLACDTGEGLPVGGSKPPLQSGGAPLPSAGEALIRSLVLSGWGWGWGEASPVRARLVPGSWANICQ